MSGKRSCRAARAHENASVGRQSQSAARPILVHLLGASRRRFQILTSPYASDSKDSQRLIRASGSGVMVATVARKS
jgi:hypothetical protein